MRGYRGSGADKRATGLRPAIVHYLALERPLQLPHVVVVVLVGRERVLELADPPAHRAAQLRQPLRPEDDQGDDQDDDYLERADVRHVCLLWGAKPNGSAAAYSKLR